MATTVFINEFHYDNTGTDAGEFIEIAGPAGTDLTGWSLVLYNGANGLVYNTIALSVTLTDQSSGYGFTTINLPSNGIQNGAPDGIALVDNTDSANPVVVQFLSYEGSFTAVDGPAAGITSTDIGVSQNGTEPIGASLQLTGTGSVYEDFIWSATTANTSGAVNTGQTFTGTTPAVTAFISEFHYDNVSEDQGEFVEVTANAGADLTGYSLVLYNGNGGASYGTFTLSGIVADQANGQGTVVVDLPVNGLQNGSPDGIALVDPDGNVVEFLSYEGSFTAADGLAAGTTSIDVGVAEASDTPVGQSLQLIEGIWTGPADASKGGVNTPPVVAANAFISEFHYDNVGTDEGEFIEVTANAGADLTGYGLVLYNGNGGASYGTFTLSGIVADQANGQGTVVVDLPSSGLQNGSPDGIALVDPDGNVVEFLSYEGVFTAADGAAAGLTSTDVGVFETGSEPVGQSLQLIDGTWTEPGIETKGEVNSADNGGGGTGKFKFIHEVQGAGTATPFSGQLVTLEAIVVGDFQGSSGLSGFFLQEEDADADADLLTSEGIFIFDGETPLVDVNVGDLVRVTGAATEFSDLTELTSVSSVEVVSAGNTLPTAATVNFPVASAADLEAAEGMLVTIPDTLFVTEYFNLDRFGEVRLSSNGPGNVPGTDGRLEQYTQFNTPDVAGYATYQADIANRQIVLDDGSNVQNPNTLIFGRDGQPLSSTNTLRGGDTVNNLTGVLSYGFGDYRIETTQGVNFQPTNPRLATPTDVGGSLKVVGLNVLNYFTTLDDATSNNNNPLTTDSGLEPRGANDLTANGITPATAEFDRQTQKLITTLAAIDADVFGLVELENSNTDAALYNIVAELNAVVGAGTYSYISSGLVGTDAITVGLIYKSANVTPVGGLAILDTPAFVDPNNTGQNRNRPALAQTFEDNNGQLFTAVVNHLKSKGQSGLTDTSSPDYDRLDGQGFWNDTRTKAAQALVDWLGTDPTGSGDSDFLLLGDFNSYAQEDPVQVLVNAGYTDLAQSFLGSNAYSYVFDGQVGTLDYAFASFSLAQQVTGTTEWHINADEPDALDYNLDFGRDPALFDGTVPFRTSDHDPVVVGLNLNSNNNQAPTAVVLSNLVNAIAEDTNTATRIKVADITITDDGLGTNVLSLSGDDAAVFELDGNELFLKASTNLDFESKSSYAVTVDVDDATVGSTPDVSADFTLSVTNVAETSLRFGQRNASLFMQSFQDGVLTGRVRGRQNGVAPSVNPFTLFAVDSADSSKKADLVDRTWLDRCKGIGIADGDDGNSSTKKRIDGDELLGISVTGFEAKDALIKVDRIASTDGAAIKVEAFNDDISLGSEVFSLGSVPDRGIQTLSFGSNTFFDTLYVSAADSDTKFTFRSVELPSAFAV